MHNMILTREEEYQKIVEAYGNAGGNTDLLGNRQVANMVVHENRVLSANEVEGISLKSESTERGVALVLTVEEGRKIEHPVDLCFGMLPQEGLQEIDLKMNVQDRSEVNIIAHCVFPNATNITHKMDADIRIGNNAVFSYSETHYHGDHGGINVIPKARVEVGENSVYRNTFALVKGQVGRLDFDYETICGRKSNTELVAKIYGKAQDDIRIAEKVHLNGEGAKSLIKSRLVLKDKARAEVVGETYGNAPLARGHVDCNEIVDGDEAIAKAVPIVSVSNRQAKVTHEAAIGSIDKKQMQTLMARGLNEEEAINVIVRGILA